VVVAWVGSIHSSIVWEVLPLASSPAGAGVVFTIMPDLKAKVVLAVGGMAVNGIR
jgi:hypothetical protein